MIRIVVFITLGLWNADALNLTCVTTAAINAAFQTAQSQTNFTAISSNPSEYELGRLGRTLQAATTILAQKCGISAADAYSAVANIDTTNTTIKNFCPSILLPYSCTAQRYRNSSGYCNNLANPMWGGVYATFRRWMQPNYADGVSTPRISTSGSQLADVRSVALNVSQDNSFVDRLWTTMFVAWGQLIDHDMVDTVPSTDSLGNTLTCCGTNKSTNDACLPINVSSTDPFYSFYKVNCLEFSRNAASPQQGCKLGARNQFNRKTSVLDASFLYGSSTNETLRLRTLSGGLLKTQAVPNSKGLKDLPPPMTSNPDTNCFRPNSSVYCFLTGDDRANQQPLLTVLHTIFVREHNRVASALQKINPQWTDEVLFQETRLIVTAEVQKITYREYVDSLLGRNVTAAYGIQLLPLGYYNGYNASINPTLPDVFNGAAFRFGHSMIPSHLDLYNSSHVYQGTKLLRQLFWQPFDLYKPGYLDQYLHGFINQMSMRSDLSIVEELTDHLLQTSTAFGSDLAARNILRGRDHGLPTYNQVRASCGLSVFSKWSDLVGTMDNNTIRSMSSVYSTPADIDLWVGGFGETPTAPPALGPTFKCIIADTFRKLRDGDRFWFENGGQPSSFTLPQLAEIRKVTLARILCDNSDSLTSIQLTPMTVVDPVINPRILCNSTNFPSMNLTMWKQ